MIPALRCDEWNPPAQSEVLVKDGRGEEGGRRRRVNGGVREGAPDGSHLLPIPDGDGGEQSDVQVSVQSWNFQLGGIAMPSDESQCIDESQ